MSVTFEETYERLGLERLMKEPYMRERDERRVLSMARNWRPELLQPLTVVRPTTFDNGNMVLIDGDHRRGAAEYRGMDTLWCQVLIGPFAEADRARLFYDLQEARRPLKPLDKFRALLAARDPEAVGVQGILVKHRLQFGPRIEAPRTVVAVVACRNAWRIGEPHGHALDESLRLLTKHWVDRERAYDNFILGAFPRFIASGSAEIGEELLLDKLDEAMEKWTPQALLREAAAVLHAQASVAQGGKTIVGVLRRLLAVEVNRRLPKDQQISG